MEAQGGSLVPSNSELTHDEGTTLSRKEKRKVRKKVKRSEKRKQAAEHARQEGEHCLQEEENAQDLEKERREHELQLQLWLQREKEAQEEADRKRREAEATSKDDDDDAWDYVEEGPAEIIWEGNEIIVRKQKVKVPKAECKKVPATEDHPVSNPLLPESLYQSSISKPLPSQNAAFEDHKKLSNHEHNPNFGTEQDKTHCPFHIKTGVCRFGVNCSRAHVYPDKSCTLLIKNMYNGPGLPLEHDEGLEYTDEEVLQSYEEFFEDVHGEFSKHGEIVNFKVCRNESSHLRGNVYVQFKSIDSALTAYGALNGRFYASKQITCEFVVVSRWRAALCGEYMRSHHKVCSHGTACNFLHCFKNPGGLYDWSDWDNPPPRSFSAIGRRSRGGSKEDKDNYKHRDHSHRHHRDGFSSKSRRSHECDDNRVSRERRYECHRGNDSSFEEGLLVDRDCMKKERQHRSSRKRHKGHHSSEGSSDESLSVERDGLRGERQRRSSDKRIREEDYRTRRREDSKKQRHRSRSKHRHERKSCGVFHDGSRTRVIVDKRSVEQRENRSRSCETSQSDGGEVCHDMRERCDSLQRYRPRSRSLSADSLEQSPEDEVALRRRKSRSRSDRHKRRHS